MKIGKTEPRARQHSSSFTIGKAKFIGQGFKVTYSDLKDSRYTKENKNIYVNSEKKSRSFTPKDIAQKSLLTMTEYHITVPLKYHFKYAKVKRLKVALYHF